MRRKKRVDDGLVEMVRGHLYTLSTICNRPELWTVEQIAARCQVRGDMTWQALKTLAKRSQTPKIEMDKNLTFGKNIFVRIYPT